MIGMPATFIGSQTICAVEAPKNNAEIQINKARLCRMKTLQYRFASFEYSLNKSVKLSERISY